MYEQGVVSICSPVNTALAPARKHMACSDSARVFLPAASRMMVFGSTMRAVAIVRRRTWYFTGWYGIGLVQNMHENRTSFPSNGVPLMGTRALTGKDSGCSGMLQ